MTGFKGQYTDSDHGINADFTDNWKSIGSLAAGLCGKACK